MPRKDTSSIDTHTLPSHPSHMMELFRHVVKSVFFIQFCTWVVVCGQVGDGGSATGVATCDVSDGVPVVRIGQGMCQRQCGWLQVVASLIATCRIFPGSMQLTGQSR